MYDPWIGVGLVIACIIVGLIPSLSNERGEDGRGGRTEFFAEKRRRSIFENRQNTIKGHIIGFCDEFVRWFTNRRLYVIAALFGILAVLVSTLT